MTRYTIVARHALWKERSAGEQSTCLLLEGGWPEDSSSALPSGALPANGQGPWRGHSLDDSIDAQFAWIDEEAQRLAGLAGAFTTENDGRAPSAAWLNALALRYYLVKLLRVAAWFTDIAPLRPSDELHLLAARHRDEDYAELLTQLATRAGASMTIDWADAPVRPAESAPPNPRWRRWLGRWLAGGGHRTTSRRIVLCGNPRLLDPVCRELVRRNCQVWWLYDRFAVQCWIRWRTAGARQLVCDASVGQRNRLAPFRAASIEYRGIDFGPLIARWTRDQLRIHGGRQTRLYEKIDAHFAALRPETLVLDEDATPMARAAIAAARRHAVATCVVQHGAPLARFGFTPPAAGMTLVWGDASRRRLEQWGVPAQHIQVVGSPWHDALLRELTKATNNRAQSPARPAEIRRAFQILLVSTIPPRDHRPDAVELHINGRTYQQMVDVAVAAAASIGARLLVRPHPRAADDPCLARALACHPALDYQFVGGGLADCLVEADCVVSLVSTAGVDATLAGIPVIQVLPQGACDILPAKEWGLMGSGRNLEEVGALLRQVALDQYVGPPETAQAFFRPDGNAARRVAEIVLDCAGQKQHYDATALAARPLVAAR